MAEAPTWDLYNKVKPTATGGTTGGTNTAPPGTGGFSAPPAGGHGGHSGGGGGNNNGGGGNGGGGTPAPAPVGGATQVVPGKANRKDPGQINVVDYSGQIVNDPSLFFRQDDPNTPQNESMNMQDHLQSMNVQNGLLDPNDPNYQMDPNALAVQAQQVGQVANRQANTYDVATTEAKVAANQMTAAQGSVSDKAQVQAVQGDMKGLATGVNEDGTINYAGQALQKYATQNMSNIIDTSTAAGKLLAERLGDGNYLDSKATLKGQLDILQAEFVDPNTGEPKIPSWAAGTARNVSKIAAFKGMSGTAATAAMSQALLEASIPIAQSDAQFFQTLTVQNLTNKQQSIINTANVLSKMEQTNVDNRMAAAIQNAKAFLDMDMKNLDNEQQTRVINNQARIQSILEDAKQENAKRLFVAESQNDMDKFYDNLNVQIAQFNSSQALDADQFNSTMSDSREKFYKEMQYNVNIANAKWRQTVEIQEDQQQYEAAALDVKNMYDISSDTLNQIWDRSDALLDYAWKSSEARKDRKAAVSLAVLQGQIQSDLEDQKGWGNLAGLAVGDILKGGDSSILGFFGF